MKIWQVTGFGNRQTSYTVRLFLKRCFAVKRLYPVWFMKIWHVTGFGNSQTSYTVRVFLKSCNAVKYLCRLVHFMKVWHVNSFGIINFIYRKVVLNKVVCSGLVHENIACYRFGNIQTSYRLGLFF